MTGDRPNIDGLMARLRERVRERRAAGAYEDPVAAQAERTRFAAMAREDDSMGPLLAQLHLVNWVNYQDPGLTAPRSVRDRLEGVVKRVLWKLLSFYHFRLFGQQNRINKLLLLGMDDYHRWVEGRCRGLDDRIAGLETARGGKATTRVQTVHDGEEGQ